MKCQKLMTDAFEQVVAEVERLLNGLTRDDVLRQPQRDSNSIGWMVWHLTRIQDFGISKLMGEEQLWIKNRWYSKFNRKRDPRDVGSGHSGAEVSAFQVPDTKTLL